MNRLIDGHHYEQTIADLNRLTGLDRDIEFYILSLRAEHRSHSTLRTYRSTLRLLARFLETQGILTSKEVEAVHVRLWMLRLQDRLAPASFHDYTVMVKAFFAWLQREGMIPTNPTVTIKSPYVPRKIQAVHTAKGLADMISVCDYDATHNARDAWLGVRNKAMILMLTDCGMRESELARIRLEHLLSGGARVKLVETKNGEERIVALSEPTQLALARYLRIRLKWNTSHDFLWLGRNGTALQPGSIYEALRRIGDRAGVTVERFIHAFRHTAGTLSLLNGASEREVGDMLGHKQLAMVRRYTATIGSEQAAERHASFSPVKHLRLK